jgi:hypothetical protein
MQIDIVHIKELFKKPTRAPAENGHVLALTGAVVIHTEDGHNVVITPLLARQLASFLPQLAEQAEQGVSYAT